MPTSSFLASGSTPSMVEPAPRAMYSVQIKGRP